VVPVCSRKQRILRTPEVAHRISSVGRDLAPFPQVFQLPPRLEAFCKKTLYLLGICHPYVGQVSI